MAATGWVVNRNLDLIRAVVGAHREHTHLIAVGVGQPRAVRRSRGHMTGERALALVLRGEAFGHLDGLAAVLVDSPQLERALLVHVKTQPAAVGTERWETGERIQGG